MIMGVLIVAFIAILFALAIESESVIEPCPACPDDATLEIMTEIQGITRATGLRLGRAPNQGTRLARFRVAQTAGASRAALLMMDEGWL